ncbi:hypothetical protein CK203_052201 [Vitis vinifera]|uniref:Uncharacterized protein n=1 Tax=Vitis vinifera TaxID=29760 RepID=A0A438GPF7_VITVI|nr:hypothetical protein CK203_052201 [Vitis vinifera]
MLESELISLSGNPDPCTLAGSISHVAQHHLCSFPVQKIDAFGGGNWNYGNPNGNLPPPKLQLLPLPKPSNDVTNHVILWGPPKENLLQSRVLHKVMMDMQGTGHLDDCHIKGLNPSKMDNVISFLDSMNICLTLIKCKGRNTSLGRSHKYTKSKGLGSRRKRRVVKDLLHRDYPNVVSFQESKLGRVGISITLVIPIPQPSLLASVAIPDSAVGNPRHERWIFVLNKPESGFITTLRHLLVLVRRVAILKDI